MESVKLGYKLYPFRMKILEVDMLLIRSEFRIILNNI